MKWKIITTLLVAFIAWSWVIPTVRDLHWLFFESASSRVCWYDSDGDGFEESGYTGYPAIKGFDWQNASFELGQNCPPPPVQ